MIQMHNPPHPGLLVKHELDDMGIPVAEAARGLGITRQALYNVINGKSGITPEMAVRLAKGIGSTPDGWLRMQAVFDLAQMNGRDIRVEQLAARVA